MGGGVWLDRTWQTKERYLISKIERKPAKTMKDDTCLLFSLLFIYGWHFKQVKSFFHSVNINYNIVLQAWWTRLTGYEMSLE
jgi:hypothetical protein